MADITYGPKRIEEIKKKIPEGYTIEEVLLMDAVLVANLWPEFSEIPQEVVAYIAGKGGFAIQWKGGSALVVVPVFSSKVEYTCGLCNRGVYTTPPHGDTSPDRFGSTALHCAECDDIFCISCGIQKMSGGGDVPCGKCGGPAKAISDAHHPSWYPGQRPI